MRRWRSAPERILSTRPRGGPLVSVKPLRVIALAVRDDAGLSPPPVRPTPLSGSCGIGEQWQRLARIDAAISAPQLHRGLPAKNAFALGPAKACFHHAWLALREFPIPGRGMDEPECCLRRVLAAAQLRGFTGDVGAGHPVGPTGRISAAKRLDGTVRVTVSARSHREGQSVSVPGWLSVSRRAAVIADSRET